jgi:Sec-independent protein translocase protein TatA
MNIGFGQLLFVILICFFLFGNVSSLVSNIKAFLKSFKNF